MLQGIRSGAENTLLLWPKILKPEILYRAGLLKQKLPSVPVIGDAGRYWNRALKPDLEHRVATQKDTLLKFIADALRKGGGYQ